MLYNYYIFVGWMEWSRQKWIFWRHVSITRVSQCVTRSSYIHIQIQKNLLGRFPNGIFIPNLQGFKKNTFQNFSQRVFPGFRVRLSNLCCNSDEIINILYIYIYICTHNMSGRVVSETQAKGEWLYIWYNTDANGVYSLWYSYI